MPSVTSAPGCPRHQARSSLSQGFNATREEFIKGWQETPRSFCITAYPPAR
jgi:hypothetical protein